MSVTATNNLPLQQDFDALSIYGERLSSQTKHERTGTKAKVDEPVDQTILSDANHFLPGFLSLDEAQNRLVMDFYESFSVDQTFAEFLQRIAATCKMKIALHFSSESAADSLTVSQIKAHLGDKISSLQITSLTGKKILEIVLAFSDKIQELSLTNCTELCDNELFTLGICNLKLQSLSLIGCSGISEKGIRDFLGCVGTPSALDLTKCMITDFLLQELPNLTKALHTLRLKACGEISLNGLSAVVKAFGRTLRQLDLSGCQIPCDSILRIISGIELSGLYLGDCKDFTDSHCEQFVRLFPRIESLDIRGTLTTYRSITKILFTCKKLQLLIFDCPDNVAIFQTTPELQLASYLSDIHQGMTQEHALVLGEAYFKKAKLTHSKVTKLLQWSLKNSLQKLYEKCAAWLGAQGQAVASWVASSDKDEPMSEIENRAAETITPTSLDASITTCKSYNACLVIDNDSCQLSISSDLYAQEILALIPREMPLTLIVTQVDDATLLRCRQAYPSIQKLILRDCPQVTYAGWIAILFSIHGTITIEYDHISLLGNMVFLEDFQKTVTLIRALLCDGKVAFVESVIQAISLNEANAHLFLDCAFQKALESLKARCIKWINEQYSQLVRIERYNELTPLVTLLPYQERSVKIDNLYPLKACLSKFAKNVATFEVIFDPNAFYQESQKIVLALLTIIGKKVSSMTIRCPERMHNGDILSWMKCCPILLHLYLDNFQLDYSALLSVIEDGPGIQRLGLRNCLSISPKDLVTILAHSNATNLIALSLSGIEALSDYDLVAICRTRPLLVELDLTGCSEITSIGLKEALHLLPNLRSLKLSMCCKIDDKALVDLCRHVPKTLKVFDISYNNKLTGRGLSGFLAYATSIEELYLSQCQLLQTADIEQIAHACKALKRIDIRGCWRVTRAALIVLQSNCKNITQIEHDL